MDFFVDSGMTYGLMMDGFGSGSAAQDYWSSLVPGVTVKVNVVVGRKRFDGNLALRVSVKDKVELVEFLMRKAEGECGGQSFPYEEVLQEIQDEVSNMIPE